MLLLNFVRTMIFLLGFIIGNALHVAYAIEGVPLVLLGTFILFLAFTLGDVAETWLVNYFNPEDKPVGTR